MNAVFTGIRVCFRERFACSRTREIYLRGLVRTYYLAEQMYVVDGSDVTRTRSDIL